MRRLLKCHTPSNATINAFEKWYTRNWLLCYTERASISDVGSIKKAVYVQIWGRRGVLRKILAFLRDLEDREARSRQSKGPADGYATETKSRSSLVAIATVCTLLQTQAWPHERGKTFAITQTYDSYTQFNAVFPIRNANACKITMKSFSERFHTTWRVNSLRIGQ